MSLYKDENQEVMHLVDAIGEWQKLSGEQLPQLPEAFPPTIVVTVLTIKPAASFPFKPRRMAEIHCAVMEAMTGWKKVTGKTLSIMEEASLINWTAVMFTKTMEAVNVARPECTCNTPNGRHLDVCPARSEA